MANNGEVRIDVTVDDSDAKKKLNDVEEAAEDAKEKIEDTGDSAKKSGKGFNILDVAMGNLVSGGIQGLISGIGNAITSLVNLADETREYREDMAKLDTAFKTAGHSVEAGQQAYEDFYAILGESDRSVEAVNHLAELTNNTEELSQWSTIAAGVTAKFGDSLPIEGLTEAANETAKVGQTTGVLADALNWVSKDSAVFKQSLGGNKKALSAFNKALKDGENVEDAFSAALAQMSTEQERSAAITSTLTGIYSDAAAEYNTMTAETQKARRATAEMEAAQARLGEAMEPVKTFVTEAKAAFFNFAAELVDNVKASIDNTRESMYGLTKEEMALAENAHAAAEKMRDMKAAADESAIGITTKYNYTQKLADELLRLADANGIVKDADKARVDFILGELNKALGTEYTLTGNVIQNYKDIAGSIEQVIATKRAQLLLAEYEAQYAEAIKEVSKQEQARANLTVAIGENVDAIEEARLKKKEARLAYEQAVEEGASFQRLELLSWEYQEAEANVAAKEKLLEDQREEYNKLDQEVKESYGRINTYEQASTLILSGETDKAMSILNSYGNGFTEAAGDAEEAHKKELEALRAKVVDTSVELGKLEADYADNHKSMTDAQKKEMEARIEAAKKEAQKARDEYYKVGGDSIEGLVQGTTDKDGNPAWNLAGKLAGIVKNAIDAARKAADSHSPSRETIALGEDIDEGLIIGVANKRNAAIEAVRGLGNDLIKEAQKAAEKEIKAIEEKTKKETKLLEDKLEHLDEIRTKNNATQIDKQKKALRKELEAKKEALKEELELAKEREKALTDYANKYEKHLTEITKLNEDYQADYIRLEEQLYQDIEKVQSDYLSKYNSRVESIRNSLGLFEIFEKGEAVKGEDMEKALKSQINALEQYNAAIDALSQREVNESFIEEMMELGVDYLPHLEALNRMTDEELTEYVAMWEEKNKLAAEAATTELSAERERTQQEIARLREVATAEAETLTAEYTDAMFTLLEEIGTGMLEVGEEGIKALSSTIQDYVSVGREMVNGIIEGINARGAALAEAMKATVNEGITATKDEAGIHSPSDVTRDELGVNLADGMGEGWEIRLKAIRAQMAADMSDITSSLRATVNAENARFARPTSAPDTGFADLARAVGIQTAGINSLAHEYRSGAGRMRPIVLQLGKRELGRAVVDVGTAETVRVGTKITGGAK